MPFYGFTCDRCKLALEYFCRRATDEVPRCPHCGGALERMVQRFSAGSGLVDSDSGDGLGGGFVDPERAAAAAEGLDRRLAAAGAAGGAKGVAGEIEATAAAAGVAIDPDWRDAAAKAASGDETAYDALVDAGVAPLARDASPRLRNLQTPKSPNSAQETDPPPGFARDPELRELRPPPLPRRRPSPWDD